MSGTPASCRTGGQRGGGRYGGLWADDEKDHDLLSAAALLMIGLGLWRGEADMVLHKGVNLCLECVGIG